MVCTWNLRLLHPMISLVSVVIIHLHGLRYKYEDRNLVGEELYRL